MSVDGEYVLDLHVAAGHLPWLSFDDPGYLLGELDAAGVDHAVLGPVGRWAALDTREGADALRDWCRRWPDRFSRWASVNPWAGSRATAELREQVAEGAIGVKLVPAQQGFSLLQSPLVDPVVTAAVDLGVPVYVVTGVPVASEPLQLAELARQYPSGVFVMGRSGRTDFAIDVVPALRAVPNLLAETAYNGAAMVADLVRSFGAHRVVFATDAPFNVATLELERLHRCDLDRAQRQDVMSGTARRLLSRAGP